MIPNLLVHPSAPSPPPWPPRLFSTSVILFLLCRQVCLRHILDFTYKWSCIQDAAKGILLSVYDWAVHHCIYAPHLLYLLLCWWTFRWFPWLGYCEQWYCEHRGAYIFSNHNSVCLCPGGGLLGHMVILFLVSWGTFILFSKVDAPTYIPTNSVGGFLFLHTLSNICYL